MRHVIDPIGLKLGVPLNDIKKDNLADLDTSTDSCDFAGWQNYYRPGVL